MRIERLDLTSDDALRAAYDFYVAAEAVDHPGLPPIPFPDVVGRLRDPAPGYLTSSWTGRTDDGWLLATGQLDLPTLDNTRSALLDVTVHPAHRRRGVGTAMANHLLAEARAAEGRELAIGEVPEPYLPTAEPAPAPAFATSLGFTRALDEIRRELDPRAVDGERLAATEAAAAEIAAGYSLLTWTGRTPEEHLDAAARLLVRISTDAPLGELDWEAEAWDAERVRVMEEKGVARGRTYIVAAARHDATGVLAGITRLIVSTHDQRLAQQDETIVLPEHRGHRLGLWIKAANLRRLLAEIPAVERVNTWNAESNTHMVAVNDVLGFVPVERWAECQRDL